MSEVEIVSAASLGDRAELEVLLEPLARRIFGDGARQPGWFRRKLEREGVDPGLSVVAVEDGRPYGYVLVGTPLAGLARTAGVGVAPGRRRRGMGTRLLQQAARAAHEHGCTRLRTLAERDRVAFYEHAGFVRCRTNHSLLNFSRGDAGPRARALDPPRGWDDIGDCTHEVAAWMQLAWERTPSSDRATLDVEGEATAHLSREGRALLVHRLTTKNVDDDSAVRIASSLLSRLPRPDPVVLYGCNTVSSITSSLVRAGWVAVQTAVVLEKPLHG